MNILIFTIGFIIFATYMFFLVRMINTQHKKQEQEHGRVNYKKQTISKKSNKIQYIKTPAVKKFPAVKRK